jgi:tetratricopeptide (TPR) repeat protein
MRILGQDLRYSPRMLLKNPCLTLIAVIMLALTAKSDATWISVAFAQEQRAIPYQDLLARAEAKTAAQEWAEAAALWEKIVEMNPPMPGYWDQLGRARLNAKDCRKAIPAFEKALELGAGYPFNAAYNIACCYALLGEKDEALKWLERALEMGFRNLQQVRTDENLKSLRADSRFTKLAALDDVSKMSRDEGWRYDLWLLARELKRIHYNPFKKVSREEFEAYVKKLHDDIPSLHDPQIEADFRKLCRMMGDGHTRIGPSTAQLSSLFAPVAFYLFTEGLFITSAAPKHRDLVGAQVLRIGDYTIDQVMEALDKVISHDNKMWLKYIGSTASMRNPRLLNGLGLIPEPDKMEIKIRDEAGKVRQVALNAEVNTAADDWVSVRGNAPAPDPLYLKHRRTNYWFEYSPEHKMVFFQYNAVDNDPNEPLTQFCDRLFKFINENEVERLVIDLRWNSGGNNFLNRPILHGLIRNDKINRRGKLFVIIGRQTFSAAMNAAAEIERHTNAIFVGEPTGSSPNFVGESVSFSLPYSKMQGTISDLYWQSSVAMDYRTWIAPLLYAPPSFELYRANRDPAMEAILAYR